MIKIGNHFQLLPVNPFNPFKPPYIKERKPIVDKKRFKKGEDKD